MSEPVIRVENLSKKYIIAHQEVDRYLTLRDAIAKRMRSLTHKFSVSTQSSKFKIQNSLKEEFWALRDVSFEIQQGERVGIIGRNGAGKSTLLKILSRITEPTSGRIQIKGRVASLLEVGTGFHPELTGRENVFLNGSILGMSKAEVKKKFDEIVAFAEVEKFLDTPVKHYSSGMYVRLAFAVAAHLEPEILIVDEVLAVGDSAFQQKCLGKMNDVAKEGRTVLFVSHNMIATQSLCERAIWLDQGKVLKEGRSSEIVSYYLQSSFSTLPEQVWINQDTAPGNSDFCLHRARVRPVRSSPSDSITVRTPFVIEFEYWNRQAEFNLVLSLQLYNEQNILVFGFGRPSDPDWPEGGIPLGLFRDECYIPGDLLNNGIHRVELFVSKNDQLIYQHSDLLVFEVRDSPDFRRGWYGEWPGVIRPVLDWTTQILEPVEHSITNS